MRIPTAPSGRVRPKLDRIEREYGRTIEGVLWELYHARGMTQQQIAEVLGIDRTYVWMLMKHFRIPTRRGIWVLPVDSPRTASTEGGPDLPIGKLKAPDAGSSLDKRG
jgi:hypothetical protein